jgi:outer membrane protein, heavy metal efflux system
MVGRLHVTFLLIICLSQHSMPSHATEVIQRAYALNEIMDLAIARHPALAGAASLIEQSRGQQVAATAYPNPSISGLAGRGTIRDPSTGVSIIEHTVTVGQPVEWPAKRAARQRAANAGLAGAQAGLEETRLTVLADVKVAFYQLLLAQRDAEVATQNLATVEDVLRTVKTRVSAGEATPFEAIKANVEVQKARKEVSRTQNALLVVRVKLNTVAAGALGKHFSIQGDFEPLRNEIDLDSITALAIERHPTLRRLGKLVEQAEQSVAEERESRIPNLTVQGSYHREAGDQSIVAGLSVPIPLWYRRQGEIQTALGAKHRMEAERLRAENDLENAITESVQEARTAKEQIEVFEKGLLQQAEQALGIARVSFRQGAASLLDLLDAQRVYRQTLLEYAQARSALAIAIARLERWTGGLP